MLEEVKMMKYIICLVVAMVLLIGLTATVEADVPANNGHNCAGYGVSQLAGPDFGQFVSYYAKLQLVDNFGLANCGQNNRKNP